MEQSNLVKSLYQQYVQRHVLRTKCKDVSYYKFLVEDAHAINLKARLADLMFYQFQMAFWRIVSRC